MYVFVMMVLASLIAVSMSYTTPARDDYISKVEPLKAEGFATSMITKHQAAISKSDFFITSAAAISWTDTGVLDDADLKDTLAPIQYNFLPDWFQNTEEFYTLRFCISEELLAAPTYDQYRGITTVTCPANSNYYQAILTYAPPPAKFSKRAVYTAIRKKLNIGKGTKQGIGIIHWNSTIPAHWDIFPIGGGDPSELPRDIDTLITAINNPTPVVPAFDDGQIVIYTKLGIAPEW
ncbi:MAG: hypothetical protein GY804_01495 [Alphaproteobacteria bacterium]|nr:hypothetical protein [Alphaproteobacteria bacterium]